tara:strand:- start:431 stop:619 length:189 start_codon:yes stop_codon:yes gene_type:complete
MTTEYWLILFLYLLGVAMYLAILESIDDESPRFAVLTTAFLWPYIAVRIILSEIFNRGDDDE